MTKTSSRFRTIALLLTIASAALAAPPAPRPPLARGWSEEKLPLAPGALAIQLAADGDALLATWIEPHPSGRGHAVRFARRAAGGSGAWGRPATVVESDRIVANWADTPGAIAAADGSTYVWWLEAPAAGAEAYDVRLAHATRGSAIFRPLGLVHEDRSPVEHGFVSAVVESQGVRLFYLDGRGTAKGGPTELRSVLVSGERIAKSELVDAAVCDCCPTSAALAGAHPLVAFRDRAPGEIRDIRVADFAGARPPGRSGEAPSTPVFADQWKIDGCPVNGPAIAVDPRDPRRVAVAWFAAPGDRARVAAAISTDGGNAFARPLVLDDSRPLGRVALAAAGDGFAVAWLARSGDGAELRFARFDAGGASRQETVASTEAGRGAGMPRLVRAGERFWLAWGDPGGAGIRLASRPAAGS